MQGNLKKIKNNNNEYIFPITVSEGVFVDSTKTLKTKLSEMDTAISNAGGGGVSPVSNLILGGNVRLKVDFIDKTIAFSTWNLWTSQQTFTLNSGTKTFSTEIGSSSMYYVCYRSNTIELIPQSNISTYTGFIIFGIMGNAVYPFSFPTAQIGVRGGRIYNNPTKSLGEVYMIGDSITFGGAFVGAFDTLNVPKVTNLGVNGKKMAGATGMWNNVADVSTTADLVTIMGGTNDEIHWTTAKGTLLPMKSSFDTNTYIGAYQYLIEGLLTKNPTLRIILFTPPRAWTDVTGTTLRITLKSIGDTVKEIGAFYNIPVIDTYHETGWNEINISAFLPDGLHPNTAGNARLTALCLGAIHKYYYKV